MAGLQGAGAMEEMRCLRKHAQGRGEGRNALASHFLPPVSCWCPLWLIQRGLADMGAWETLAPSGIRPREKSRNGGMLRGQRNRGWIWGQSGQNKYIFSSSIWTQVYPQICVNWNCLGATNVSWLQPIPRLLSRLSRVWLCNLKDCSPPGSSVHGIFLARILEWIAISSSRGSFQPRDLPLNQLGSPILYLISTNNSKVRKDPKAKTLGQIRASIMTKIHEKRDGMESRFYLNL